jgi:Uma2 family endonuclease
MGLVSARHVELIEGDIVEKTPANPPHAIFLQWMYLALVQLFGRDYVILNFTLRIDDWNLPDPEVAIMTRPVHDFLLRGKPMPSDVRLVVEISDETLNYDRITKAQLYTRARSPEYWVMDVAHRKLIAHRRPEPGGYAETAEYVEGDAIEPLASPGTRLPLAELLP